MTREVVDVPLSVTSPGSHRSVRIVRYGSPDARPKAYIHAALHADEVPGLLVVHHLLELLDAADARGEVQGQIAVVPYANPIGLSQFINGEHFGRFDLASGKNFNRGWPSLTTELAERIGGGLGGNSQANTDLIRRAMRDCLDERAAHSETDSLYLALAREAFDADLVLDLHCDDEGLMHLFVRPELWPELSDIACELACRAVIMQGVTGGATFAEACVEPWLELAAAFPGNPIHCGCLGATIELRGFIDVADSVASADASALMNVLRRRGYLRGRPTEVPAALCGTTLFDACDIVRTPIFGVLVYHVELGETVTRGQPIADVIDPSRHGLAHSRYTIVAGTDGTVITRRLRKLVAADQVIAKIAGSKPLGYRQGYALED